MIKIAICDDEILAAGELEKLLLEIAEENMLDLDIDLFYNALTLEKSFLTSEKYDILFLDIQMNIQDGITAAKNIRKIDQNVLIIYVSSYDSYWQELFEVDAFDFIKKPIDRGKVESCFLGAYDRISSMAYYFEFQYRNEWIKVAMGEILYFESKGRKIQISLVDGRTEVFNAKLNDVEDKIKNSKNKIPFLRIHQSYLVNFHFIRSFSKVKVRLKNDENLPVSEERHKAIREKYSRLLGGEISG